MSVYAGHDLGSGVPIGAGMEAEREGRNGQEEMKSGCVILDLRQETLLQIFEGPQVSLAALLPRISWPWPTAWRTC
jgi:hypothetical protein